MTDTTWLSRVELADRFGVEPMTISNYVKRGMPHRKQGRAHQYDAAVCDAWLAAYRDHEGQFPNASNGVGGKREGAGRPKSTPKVNDAADGGMVKAESPEKSNTVKLAITPDAFLQMVRDGATASDVSASTAAYAQYVRMQERDKDAGKLLNGDDARDAMRAWCERIRNAMLKLPGTVSQRSGEIGLDQAGGARLKSMVHAEVVRLLNSVRKEAQEEL